MKKRNYLTLILAGVIAAGLFSSCDEDPSGGGAEGKGIRTLSTGKLVFSREESALRFTIVSDVNYTIEKTGDWIHTDINKGVASAEPETVRVGVDSLPGNEDRAALILVTSAGKIDTVAVRQYAAAVTTNVTDTIFLPDTDDVVKKKFSVRSTHRWTVSADSWISLSTRSTAANTSTVVEATVAINSEPGERTGKIEFYSVVGEENDTLSTAVWVKQGKGAFFKVDKSAVELSDRGEYKKVTISASREWSLTSDAPWLHVDHAGGSAGKSIVKITGDERTDAGTDYRTGEITVAMGGQTKKIAVSQGPKGIYYDDGDVLLLHRHTVGDGVVLVGIGDGFDRTDLKKGGDYETVMTRLFLDYVLDCEVFRDFRDYFDVYLYMAESKESGVFDGTDNAFGSGRPSGSDFNKMARTINNNPVFKDAGLRCPDDISVIFAGNGMIGGYAIFETRTGVYSFDEPMGYYWASHEFVGHAFGGLADEYVSNCSYMGGPSSLRGMQESGTGRCLNVSWTTDTDLYWTETGGTTTNIAESNGLPCVPWKPFLDHPQYTGKNKVGFDLGGFYCPTDVWKPEPPGNSVMVNWNGGRGHYNAQSRWILYQRIHALSHMPCTFETFVQYDRRNLLQ
ncbi:MAG: hypothetical protein LBH61_06530 [Dysgonamonadaceae bacterium]|jgi:hypothetical protein|nr:hypothetical protein [Dysgonamonadaceae bacterium]